MGRAKYLRAYIKQGREEATLEVEVKGHRGKRNSIVWRKFNRLDKSEWKLNGELAKSSSSGPISSCPGKSVNNKAVRAVVSSYGIQANNLW
jgi:hypothetical protein